MRSISASFSAGITGATITVVGMPASDSRRSASSRFGGVEARGSMVRASVAIERRDRERHLGEIALGHPRQDVDVAR